MMILLQARSSIQQHRSAMALTTTVMMSSSQTIPCLLFQSGDPQDLTGLFAGDALNVAQVSLTDAGVYQFCSGTYYSSIDVQEDASLVALGDVVLDGGGQATVVSITADGKEVSISDMTIQNGAGNQFIFSSYNESGGGISCYAHSDLSLSQVEVLNNSGDVGVDQCAVQY